MSQDTDWTVVRLLLGSEDIREKLDFSSVCAWGRRDYNKLHTHPSRNTRQVSGEEKETKGEKDSHSRYCVPYCVVLLRFAQEDALFHNGLIFLTFPGID
jgi:hypothetical protein